MERQPKLILWLVLIVAVSAWPLWIAANAFWGFLALTSVSSISFVLLTGILFLFAARPFCCLLLLNRLPLYQLIVEASTPLGEVHQARHDDVKPV